MQNFLNLAIQSVIPLRVCNVPTDSDFICKIPALSAVCGNGLRAGLIYM